MANGIIQFIQHLMHKLFVDHSLWFVFDVWLSHENGEKSGEESAWLARTTGIKEGVLRRGAHVVLFFVLALLAGVGFGVYRIVGVVV